MSSDDVDDIWNALYRDFGDRLRVVTLYLDGEFETRMRPDLRETYSTSEDERIVEEAVLDGLTRAHQEQLFDAGRLLAFTRVFEEAYVVHGPFTDTAGGLISIQRTGGRADTGSSSDADADIGVAAGPEDSMLEAAVATLDRWREQFETE